MGRGESGDKESGAFRGAAFFISANGFGPGAAVTVV